MEGPTDELIVQAAYNSKYQKLPISDGIDIISVQSLAFKRFCDIAELINKPVLIVTDNDGSILENITNKYIAYEAAMKAGKILIFYEKNEALYTLEPSFVYVNKSKLKELRTLFGLADTATENEIISYMKKHKTEWALRIFDNADKFDYPENINECISHVKK